MLLRRGFEHRTSLYIHIYDDSERVEVVFLVKEYYTDSRIWSRWGFFWGTGRLKVRPNTPAEQRTSIGASEITNQLYSSSHNVLE